MNAIASQQCHRAAGFGSLAGMLAVLAAVGCAASTPRARAPERPKPLTVQTAPELGPIMQRLQRELAAIGFTPSGEGFSGFLPGGDHATFPVHIPKGRCVMLVALTTHNAHDADAALYTPEGELLAVDSEPDSHPTIQACAPEVARKLYYVIQIFDGDGSFLVVPFHGAQEQMPLAARVVGGRPAFVTATRTPELHEDPLATLTEGLRKRGYESQGEPLVFPLAEHERIRTPLSVERGQCYTIAAFGDLGLRELGLRVLDDRGDQVSISDTNERHAALQLCTRTSAGYAIEFVAHHGAGEVRLLTYRADVVAAGGEAGLWLGRVPEAGAKPTGERH